MRFSQIVELLDIAEASSLEAQPELNPEITGISAVQDSQPATISYIEGQKFAPYIEQTANAALILPMDASLQERATECGIAWVSTQSPRLGFARAIALFYEPYYPSPGIHPPAIIAPPIPAVTIS